MTRTKLMKIGPARSPFNCRGRRRPKDSKALDDKREGRIVKVRKCRRLDPAWFNPVKMPHIRRKDFENPKYGPTHYAALYYEVAKYHEQLVYSGQHVTNVMLKTKAAEARKKLGISCLTGQQWLYYFFKRCHKLRADKSEECVSSSDESLSEDVCGNDSRNVNANSNKTHPMPNDHLRKESVPSKPKCMCQKSKVVSEEERDLSCLFSFSPAHPAVNGDIFDEEMPASNRISQDTVCNCSRPGKEASDCESSSERHCSGDRPVTRLKRVRINGELSASSSSDANRTVGSRHINNWSRKNSTKPRSGRQVLYPEYFFPELLPREPTIHSYACVNAGIQDCQESDLNNDVYINLFDALQTDR